MFEKLQNAMAEVAKFSNHKGYWYNVEDVLTVMVCGLLCSLENIEDIQHWSRTPHIAEFLKKEFGIENLPKKAQFYNILSYVNYKQFNVEFEKWIISILQGNLEGETVAIDGKSIRSTAKLRKSKSALHIASAMIASSGIIIGSKECEYAKSSEIGAFREMIKELSLKGTMVVADALHCKPKSAEAVIEAEADYLLVVKDNNKNLKENIDLLSHNKNTDKFSQTEENGGRIETRTAYVSNIIDNLPDKEKWKNLAYVGAIHREVTKKNNPNEQSSEWHFYISSRDLSAQELLHHARLEWSIESMHWLLDVHFREDETKIRDMELQKNLNLLRKIVINIVKQYQASLPKHVPMSRILKQNLFDINSLSTIIAHFKENGELE